MPARDRRRFALLALGASGTVLLITLLFAGYGLSTLDVHLAAVRSWIIGDGLYAYRQSGTQAGAALSPALALLLAPLAVLPLPVAGWVLAATSLAALLLALTVLAAPVARRYGLDRTALVLTLAGLSLLTGPVRATIGLGRTDLLLFGLVVADLVALRRAARTRDRWLTPDRIPPPARRSPSRSARYPDRSPWQPDHSDWSRSDWSLKRSGFDGDRSPAGRLRQTWHSGAWAGVGIGLATAFAAGPVLMIGCLLAVRERRAALRALATAATITLAALVAAPAETLTWYGAVLWELDRAAPISAADNQSLAGVLARLYGFAAPPVLVWSSFGVLLLAVGLIRARSAYADGDRTAAFTLAGLAGAAAGPVTGAGEAVWLLPAVLILADEALRRRPGVRSRARFGGVGLAVTALAGYAVLLADPFLAVTLNAIAVVLILLVNALPWRHGSTPALPARRPPAGRAAAIPGPRGG